MTSQERFPTLDPAVLTDEQKRVMANITSGPRGDVRGPFVPLMRSPTLCDRVQSLGEYLRFGTKLSAPVRELGILLTARWANCEYEFQAHRLMGLKAGLAAEKIDAVGAGKRPENMSDDEALVYDILAEVLASGTLSDATFARGKAALGEQGIIDVVALPGYYLMLALVLNVSRVPVTQPDRGDFAAGVSWPSKG